MKKTFSLQFELLLVILAVVLIISSFVSSISIHEIDRYAQNSTEDLIRTACENEGKQINAIFDGLEKSVRIMQSYILALIDDGDISDDELQSRIIAESDEMFRDVAHNTNGTVAYYLRFDPAISTSVSGLFYSKIDNGDRFICLEPTDISMYPEDDIEHVGWFWEPYKKGEPVWMMPYHNLNNDVMMISYVIPMYLDDLFIGVVGMDFDYTVLTQKIDSIRVYENSFAHLEHDGTVVYQNDPKSVTSAKNEPSSYLRATHELDNGMTLVLSASHDDIQKEGDRIGMKIAITVILLTLFICTSAVLAVRKFIHPLKKLTESATRLSDGDYDIEIIHSKTREIELLSSTLKIWLYSSGSKTESLTFLHTAIP